MIELKTCFEREKVLKVKGKQGRPRTREKEQEQIALCLVLCLFVVINYSNLINQSCYSSVQTFAECKVS